MRSCPFLMLNFWNSDMNTFFSFDLETFFRIEIFEISRFCKKNVLDVNTCSTRLKLRRGGLFKFSLFISDEYGFEVQMTIVKIPELEIRYFRCLGLLTFLTFFFSKLVNTCKNNADYEFKLKNEKDIMFKKSKTFKHKNISFST